jgi:hypothetical protein
VAQIATSSSKKITVGLVIILGLPIWLPSLVLSIVIGSVLAYQHNAWEVLCLCVAAGFTLGYGLSWIAIRLVELSPEKRLRT